MAISSAAHRAAGESGGTSEARPRGITDALLALLTGAMATAIAWYRMTPVTRSTIWAEDGTVFLTQALRRADPLGTWFLPYDGYLHVVPRAIAELTTMLSPPERYAVVMSGASCLVVGVLAAVVTNVSRPVVPSMPLRVLLALVPVLVPSAAREVIGNATNLHWFFLAAAPWLLLARPRSRVGAVLLGVVALVTTLTEIQAVLFAPLLAYRWGDRRTHPVKAGFVIGLVGQGIALVSSPRRPPTGPPPAWDDVLHGYLVNAVLSLWVGSSEAVTAVVAIGGWGASALLVVPSLAAVGVTLVRGHGADRLAVVTLTVASVVAWVAAFVVNRPGYFYPQPGSDGQPPLIVIRYAPPSSAFLLAAMVVCLATIRWRWWSTALVVVLAVPLVASSWSNFVAADATRSAGPVWLEEIPAARQNCVAQQGLTQPVPVAPPGFRPASIPCDVLRPPG